MQDDSLPISIPERVRDVFGAWAKTIASASDQSPDRKEMVLFYRNLARPGGSAMITPQALSDLALYARTKRRQAQQAQKEAQEAQAEAAIVCQWLEVVLPVPSTMPYGQLSPQLS